MKLFFGQIYPEVIIHDEEQNHISKVLRMRAGEEIVVTDGEGNAAKGRISFEGKKTVLTEVEILQQAEEFVPKLHVAIAPTKNIDRIEFFVEKATELGITEITFLNTEKTERRHLNIDKIRKQAVAASKQSLRFRFPVINDLTKLNEFISSLDSEKTYICHCNDSLQRIDLQKINTDIGSDKITFLVGPEGDFSDKEIQMMAEKNIQAVSLGRQRLRTETAGVFIAAWNYTKMI